MFHLDIVKSEGEKTGGVKEPAEPGRYNLLSLLRCLCHHHEDSRDHLIFINSQLNLVIIIFYYSCIIFVIVMTIVMII